MSPRSTVVVLALVAGLGGLSSALADEPGPEMLVQELAARAVSGSVPPVPEPPPPAAAPGVTALATVAPRPGGPPASDPTPTLRSDAIEYPYGESQPTVTCTPLSACDVELQAGEQVHGIALGDTERWLASPLFSGAPEALVPHVVVKPRDYDLATNLVIATTRRTYHLSLISPPRSQAASIYVRRVTFRYPDELVAVWNRAEDLRRTESEREAQRVAAPLESPSLTDLEFGYRIEVPRSGKPEWTPVRVFDDGRRTYLEMPRALAATDAPALFALEEGGSTAIINYRVAETGRWWIADGVYSQLRLVLGVGRHQRFVTISRVR